MSYKTLAQLLELLEGLERDLGLESALPVERDIVAIIGAFYEDGVKQVKTEMIAEHPLLSGVSKSTLHRSIRALLARGVIRTAEGRKTGMYVLARHI